jgi:DNA repair exonuclease SbcCD nuclease subunit
MKIAIVTDTHFGARNDSQLFLDHFVDFFQETFFPALKKYDIDTVIHAGDLMDRRKYVNFNTLNTVRKKVLEPMRDMGVTMHCILGNHDTYYKNTNDVNSIKELFDEKYDNFLLYEKPQTIELGGMDLALVPWINSENRNETDEFLKSTPAQWVIGHFELDGYEVLRGHKFEGGMDPKQLSRFEQVLSGHFHCRQDRGNVMYLGTPYQITFADSGEKKGFWILDTETREMEFVKNPDSMFHSLSYDDESKDYTKFIGKAHPIFRNKYVKIYVHKKKNPYILDRVMDALYNSGVYSLTVVDDTDRLEREDIEAADITKSTLEIILEEVDDKEEIENKDGVKQIIREIYMEAISS